MLVESSVEMVDSCLVLFLAPLGCVPFSSYGKMYHLNDGFIGEHSRQAVVDPRLPKACKGTFAVDVDCIGL